MDQQALTLYSSGAYRYINAFLLQNELLGVTRDKAIYYGDVNGNQITISQVINHLDTVFNALQQDNYDGPPFHVVRVTNPALFEDKLIERYTVNDTIKFATYVSTGHRVFDTLSGFTKQFSPLVIFRFFLSKQSNGQFVFMQTRSQYNNENEVLLNKGLTFKILNKYYVNIETYKTDAMGNQTQFYIQKLLFDLVIEGDDEAEEYYDREHNVQFLPAHMQPGYAHHFSDEITRDNAEFIKQVQDEEPYVVRHTRRNGIRIVGNIDNNPVNEPYVVSPDNNYDDEFGPDADDDYIQPDYSVPPVPINRNAPNPGPPIVFDPNVNVPAPAPAPAPIPVNPVPANIPAPAPHPAFAPGAPLHDPALGAPVHPLNIPPPDNFMGVVAQNINWGLSIFPNCLQCLWPADVQGGGESDDLDHVDFETMMAFHLCNAPSGEEHKYIKLPQPVNGYNYVDRSILEFSDDEVAKKYGYVKNVEHPDIFAELRNDMSQMTEEEKNNKYHYLSETVDDASPILQMPKALERMVTGIGSLFAFNMPDTKVEARTAEVAGGNDKYFTVQNCMLVIIIALLLYLIYCLFKNYKDGTSIDDYMQTYCTPRLQT
jgi:hypothetical protein